MAQDDTKEWDAFWLQPTVTSIPGTFTQNYDGSILAFWKKCLAVKPARILDLACGNGALTWLLDREILSDSCPGEIVGVDFSNIDPFRSLALKPEQHPAVRFLPNTPIESLPFEDSTFDMAVSQWGIEYSDWAVTIGEVSRVLKPDSTIALVCHFEGSDLIQDCELKRKKYVDAIDSEDDLHGLFLSLDSLYNLHGEMSSVVADANHFRLVADISSAMGNLLSRLDDSEDETVIQVKSYVQQLNQLFSASRPVSDPTRRDLILQGKRDIQSTIARLDNLLDAALDQEQLEALVSHLEEGGFAVEHCERLIHTDSESGRNLGNVGKSIVARRNQG